LLYLIKPPPKTRNEASNRSPSPAASIISISSSSDEDENDQEPTPHSNENMNTAGNSQFLCSSMGVPSNASVSSNLSSSTSNHPMTTNLQGNNRQFSSNHMNQFGATNSVTMNSEPRSPSIICSRSQPLSVNTNVNSNATTNRFSPVSNNSPDQELDNPDNSDDDGSPNSSFKSSESTLNHNNKNNSSRMSTPSPILNRSITANFSNNNNNKLNSSTGSNGSSTMMATSPSPSAAARANAWVCSKFLRFFEFNRSE
jgi:hypothetical protein